MRWLRECSVSEFLWFFFVVAIAFYGSAWLAALWWKSFLLCLEWIPDHVW